MSALSRSDQFCQRRLKLNFVARTLGTNDPKTVTLYRLKLPAKTFRRRRLTFFYFDRYLPNPAFSHSIQTDYASLSHSADSTYLGDYGHGQRHRKMV